jgi:opacity protein-like surface antigen
MRKLFFVIFVLFLLATPILAQTTNDPSTYFKSYLKNGDLSIYASIGWWLGLCANVGAELVLGEWNIADILPIDFSVGVRALYEGWSYFNSSYSVFGVAPMFIIHIGTVGNFDFYEGIGIGFAFSTGSWSVYNDFEIGFAAVSGATWYLSNNLGLILEYAYIGWVSSWGVGVTLKI